MILNYKTSKHKIVEVILFTFKHHSIISSRYNFFTSDLVKKLAIKNTAATAHASFDKQYNLHIFIILKEIYNSIFIVSINIKSIINIKIIHFV